MTSARVAPLCAARASAACRRPCRWRSGSRSGCGAGECGGDAETGDELRDRPVIAVGDVVRANGGERGVGGDPVADLLPGLPAQLLDRLVGVFVDRVQIISGQLVEE